MSSTEWSAKIKSLRALISQQPNNETKSPPSRSPPKPKQLPTQELPSQETKQKTPSPPIRRLSHEQIPDVQKLVRETIEQSGLNTADSYNKNIVNAVASAVAHAVTTALNKAEDSQSDEVDVLRRRNTELEQRTQSVEHQLSSISPTSVRGTMDNVTRDLFSECESTGASAWPFTLATKDAVMVATNSSPPRLNRLLGLHLSLGRQCRTMRNDTEMLKKVIEHMKTESQRRQKRQQEQINALKHRLTVQQQQLESSQTTQTQSYSPFASASSSLSSTTNSFKIPNTTMNASTLLSARSRSPSPSTSPSSPPYYHSNYLQSSSSSSPPQHFSSVASPSISSISSVTSVSSPTTADVREKKIKHKLKAAAYGSKGINWKRLFRFYDRDNSGTLQFNEFKNAVRKDGKMTKQVLSDRDLRFLFKRVDRDGGGEIDINEFSKWLKTSQVDTSLSSPSTTHMYTTDTTAMDTRALATSDIRPQPLSPSGRARSNSNNSQRSSGSHAKTHRRVLSVVHMTTSDFAKARRSIREAILHLAHRLTRHNNDSSDGATEHIHDLWKSHFLTYSERGEHGISLKSFRTAVRRSLNISSAEVSDTHVRGIFESIDDDKSGSIEYPEFRDWLNGTKRKGGGAYTAGLHDHHIPIEENNLILSSSSSAASADVSSSPAKGVAWHTKNTQGTTYGITFNRQTASSRSEKSRETVKQNKRTSALKGVSPDTLMSRLKMKSSNSINNSSNSNNSSSNNRKIGSNNQYHSPSMKKRSNATVSELVAQNASLSPQIAAIPTLIDDPYMLEQHGSKSFNASPNLTHAHRRTQSWGLEERDLVSTYGTYKVKGTSYGLYGQIGTSGKKNSGSGKKTKKTSSNKMSYSHEPAPTAADILPEYRKFKGAYRKQYAQHLQPTTETEEQSNTEMEQTRSDQIHQHVANYKQDIHNTNAMDQYTVGTHKTNNSNSSMYKPGPPPHPPPPAGSPPALSPPAVSPPTSNHSRKPSRQRRVSILSPNAKKNILLKSRKDEKKKSKERLKYLSTSRNSSYNDLNNDNEDYYNGGGGSDDAKEDYDAMINDLDGILEVHPSVVRQRRASYNVVKQSVVGNGKTVGPSLTPFLEGGGKNHDTVDPLLLEQQTQIEISKKEKRAPTWILTRGLSKEEIPKSRTNKMKTFKWSTLEAERIAKEAQMNDARAAKRKKREERGKRNKTAQSLYGKSHTVLRDSSIIHLSLAEKEKLRQIEVGSKKISKHKTMESWSKLVVDLEDVQEEEEEESFSTARPQTDEANDDAFRPSEFDMNVDEMPSPPQLDEAASKSRRHSPANSTMSIESVSVINERIPRGHLKNMSIRSMLSIDEDEDDDDEEEEQEVIATPQLSTKNRNERNQDIEPLVPPELDGTTNRHERNQTFIEEKTYDIEDEDDDDEEDEDEEENMLPPGPPPSGIINAAEKFLSLKKSPPPMSDFEKLESIMERAVVILEKEPSGPTPGLHSSPPPGPPPPGPPPPGPPPPGPPPSD